MHGIAAATAKAMAVVEADVEATAAADVRWAAEPT
jgi:hypothetical protein